MKLGKVDYLSTSPQIAYRCSDCDERGVKLWREYNTFADAIELRCCNCLAKLYPKDGPRDEDGRGTWSQSYESDTWDGGSYVPAIPTAEGDTYWGYTSVPNAGVRWWKCLPNRVTDKARDLPPAEPEPVKPDYEAELKEWQDKTAYVVEATSNEQLDLWNRWHKLAPGERDWAPHGAPKNAPWEQMSGCLTTVGKLAKMPVCISMMWARIHGQLVLFWHPTSLVVDHRLIEKWLDKNVPAYKAGKSTNASNFHNCVHELARNALSSQAQSARIA